MEYETKRERLVRKAQSQQRVPALSVALHRTDRPIWTFQVGEAGEGKPLDAGTQFRLASITKTFTMILVMQVRDAGLLHLDDPIGAHLELAGGQDRRIRDLLSHSSGMQRESARPKWESYRGPTIAEVLEDYAAAPQVHPAQRRFHYSNLAFAALGHMVAAKRGGSWAEVLQQYILAPAGLSDITVEPAETAATGYLVDRYSDYARPEPVTHSGGASPAGQLWGTPADVARWAAFLADPAALDPQGRVLAASSVAEARQPHTVRDAEAFDTAIGLGLIIIDRGNRVIDIGHDGASFGYLAKASGRRGPDVPPGLGAAVMASSGTADAVLGLAPELLDLACQQDPADIPRWTPATTPPPPEYTDLLGRWWSEGFGFDFHWRDGALCAYSESAPHGPPAVFQPDGADRMRTISGRETGEDLTFLRDEHGEVTEMRWATYPVTRQRTTPGPASS